MSSLPIDSASELPANWSLVADDSSHTSSESADPDPTTTNTTSTASMATLAALDLRSQGLEWRPSLNSDPQTPSGNLDVLHEFIESWDDDMLRTGADAGGIGPMMALLGASSSVSASTPLHARHVHMQSPVHSKSHVAARNTSPTSSSSGSDKGIAGLLYDDEGDDENELEPVTKAATKATRAPARKRIRRKVEIVQLRDESAFLEKQLYELREYWKNAPAMLQEQQAPTSSSSSVMVCAEPMWKQIAHHQKELLAESERKNLSLRTEYSLQRKIAGEMRKVLMKRATSPTDFDSALYLMRPQNPLLMFDENHQTFQTLLHDIEPMIGELASVERIMASRSQANATFRDWQVQEDSLNERFVDLVNSYVLPFDRLQVNKAMRRLYGEGNTTNCEKRFTEHFECVDDRICRQVIHAYSNDRRSGHVRHREAVRNFSDATQSIFLVITLIQPVTATGKPIHSVMLREKQWTIVRSGAGNGRVATTGATSTVVTYHKITQEYVSDEYRTFWTPSMIMEGMVPMWNSSLGVIKHRLECFLIEQGMSNSRRLQASELR